MSVWTFVHESRSSEISSSIISELKHQFIIIMESRVFTILTVYLFVLFNIQKSIAKSDYSNYKREEKKSYYINWVKEIKESLQQSISGQCNMQFNSSSSIETVDSNTISVSYSFPSMKEVYEYNNRPTMLSKGNKELPTLLKQPMIAAWANENIERWMIPSDHPG